MKFWVCCEVRAEHNNEYRGYALLVDWNRKEVLRRYEVPAIFDVTVDKNCVSYRCGGIRSMTPFGDEIWVLTNGGYVILDAETLTEKRRFKTKYTVGGHYLVWFDGGFWVDSGLDLIIKVGVDGSVLDVIQLAANKKIVRKLGMQYVERDLHFDYSKWTEMDIHTEKDRRLVDQLHLNTIQVVGKELYGFTCKRGIVKGKKLKKGKKTFTISIDGGILFRLYPDPDVLLEFEDLVQPHDGLVVGNYFVVNDSYNQKVVIYDREPTEVLRQVNIPVVGKLAETAGKSKVGYVRGMGILNDTTVVVGTSPLAVHEIDLVTGNIVGSMYFDGVDNWHTCHGINVLGDG